MTPREFVDQELSLVAATFAIAKVIRPMVVLVKDGERYAVPAMFQNAAHKEIVAQGIKDLVRTSRPDVVVYMAEARMKVVQSLISELPTSISQYDDAAIEVVSVVIEFKTGEKFDCDAKITRTLGIPRLEKFKVSDGKFTAGRFADFFPVGRLN